MKKSKQKMKRYLPLYLMLVPGTVYLIINNYMPMAGLALAFKKINYSIGIFQSPWTGFSNFTYLFSTNDAFLFFRNTILYNLAFIFLGNFMGIFTAIALDCIKKKFFKRISQVVILIPYLLSTVIISYIVYAFLSGNNGFMNMTILPMLGLDKVNWYNEAKYWPFILTIVYLWMSFGYSSILYYSTLIGIDKSYYEAAVVDGAGTYAQIRHITLPALKTTIITMILLAVGRICYSDFGLFYQVPMNSGLLYSTTQTIDTYVYRGLLELNDIGRSTAAGFLQSVLGFICVFTANTVVSKLDKDSSLF
ncbi:sugar ABC transporter permease [bacterium 1xD8-48]|jgi:putative aldouronate transport system permease protein|nr:sugar ABC transporter permease [Lachnospiraceae bacterium]MCI9325713.1 sugar ABC transporter permease [Lachnospiraceae bacterium]NBJ98939.1 sugar ABC transporter permease [bacterium 1xD8-48]